MLQQADERPVRTRRDDFVGWVTLNRPAKRNAISQAMRTALDESLAELGSDDAIRVVVLTGAGPAFCAGVDLTDRPAADQHPMAAAVPPVAHALTAFAKPLIAAINGPAVGGGLELALACDVRVAARSAQFALPEVRIGSLPGSGGTQRLMRAIQPAIAARMLLSGDPMSAQEGLRVGLISDLVDDDELAGFAGALARRIAANAPLSLRAMKQCLLAAREAPLAGGLELERTLWALLATTADRQEGRAAFRERRLPRFTGG
ncbi:MAG: enoyl-CoA hydratase/isomerase family protein [Streptosporangiaceae bacterium]